MIVIRTSLRVDRFETIQEALAFGDGYCAALDAFGIYKDGVQTIGCLETPIQKFKQEMHELIANAVNAACPP